MHPLKIAVPALRLRGNGSMPGEFQTAIMAIHHYIHFIMSILIKVISAQLSRDTELFSNMDPYCILKLGSQTQRTKTKDEAGKKPVWNQSFRFSNAENNLNVIIMDEDGVSDDKVGEGQLDLSRFRGSSAQQECIVQLYFKGKAAGKVMLRISGTGGQAGNNFNQGQGNTWGNNQPNNNGAWGQQNNQWGGNQPTQPQQNNGWGMPPQNNNNQWGGMPQQNNAWGTNQNSAWNQQPQPQPGQFGNQGANQWGAQGGMTNPNQPPLNPNQPPLNPNQFNPILQGIFQGSSQWGQQASNPPGNQWGNQPPNSQWGGQQQPPNSQWGNNPQAPNPNQGWGNNMQNPKPNNELGYPDLEYKPPINNNVPNPQQGNATNMDVPFKLIGGMQGLFGKPNNSNEGGNPYQV